MTTRLIRVHQAHTSQPYVHDMVILYQDKQCITLQKTLMRKHTSHSVSRAKIVKIKRGGTALYLPKEIHTAPLSIFRYKSIPVVLAGNKEQSADGAMLHASATDYKLYCITTLNPSHTASVSISRQKNIDDDDDDEDDDDDDNAGEDVIDDDDNDNDGDENRDHDDNAGLIILIIVIIIIIIIVIIIIVIIVVIVIVIIIKTVIITIVITIVVDVVITLFLLFLGVLFSFLSDASLSLYLFFPCFHLLFLFPPLPPPFSFPSPLSLSLKGKPKAKRVNLITLFLMDVSTISGNGTSSKCWFDPAVCSFRSISTAYSPLPPVEEPSCAY
uniref:Uncharacterized protein n=1 Tax=Octopus bimaculoides TaxID=37653 RepID=A0A0L8H821_OCTBM